MVCLALIFFYLPLFALDGNKVEKEVGLNEKLGGVVDRSLSFSDEFGKSLTIGELLIKDNRPLVLIPVYYSCPRLCGLVLSGVAQLIKDMSLTAGKEYAVLTLSFKSNESSELAHKRGKEFRALAGVDNPDNWIFATGKEEEIHKLMQQVGFKYRQEGGDYAHSAALILITPDGRVSKYFSDINFSSNDVRLALVEASEGNIGSLVDHLMLFCYRFDPLKGRYTFAAWNFARIGTVIFLLAFVWIVIFFIKKGA
jgi:protein SCO1/2